MRHILFVFLTALILAPLGSLAQDVPPADAAQTAGSDSVAVKFIPISDLANQTAEIAKRLRAAMDLAFPNSDVAAIVENWTEFTEEQAAFVVETDERIASEASDEQLQELLRKWEVRRQQLATWVNVLDNRIDKLNPELSVMTESRDSWSLTRSVALRDSLPASVVAQIDTVLSAIGEVVSRLRTQLDVVLEIDGRVTLENVEAVAVLERLAKYQTEVLADRLSRP